MGGEGLGIGVLRREIRANYAHVVLGLHRCVKPRPAVATSVVNRPVLIHGLVATIDGGDAAETVGPPFSLNSYRFISKQRQMIPTISATSAIASRTV